MIDIRNSLKGAVGDRVFRIATIGMLILMTLFFAGIILSLFTYTSWQEFLEAVSSKEVLFAVGLSLTTATISTVIAMIVALPVAYALSKNDFPGKTIIDSLLDLPVVMSPIAIGAALLVFFSTPFGSAINNHLIDFVFSVKGIILAQFTIVSALAIRLLKAPSTI
jgi:molybdate transport system permease protein